MLTLTEARSAIIERLQRAEKTERVALEHAAGRILAGPIRALVANPAFDNSAMDGYAVRSADLRATHQLPIRGESACGDEPKELAVGSTMRIFTGAPLPRGADRVVMQEDVTANAGIATFTGQPNGDSNVRRAGEDFHAGDELYRRGKRLGAIDIALLSAAGVPYVDVFPAPRVLVFATGDELIAPGQPLRPGQIYESNRIATLLQLRALGADVVDGGTVADNADALRAVLRDAQRYDFVVTSGGASVGDRDLVKLIFAEIGSIDFWRVKIKPGKPLAFGRVGARSHFFALPGNPVSSLVTFKLFVEPAILAWSYAPHYELRLRAVAANDCTRVAGRMEFLRARLRVQDGQLYAEALPGQGSHMLGTLRETNGLVQVEAESEGFRRGDSVIAIPLTLDIE